VLSHTLFFSFAPFHVSQFIQADTVNGEAAILKEIKLNGVKTEKYSGQILMLNPFLGPDVLAGVYSMNRKGNKLKNVTLNKVKLKIFGCDNTAKYRERIGTL